MNRPVVALQEHLSNAGGAAEIPIYLKRWMQVPQVRQRRLGEQRLEIRIGLVTILQPRPEIDDPRAAPAGVAAAVGETALNRGPRGASQLRRAAHRDLIAGM